MIYPDNSNATYTSLLNYSDDLDKPFQRWLRYKEGFSVFLSECKLDNYTRKQMEMFKAAYEEILGSTDIELKEYTLPKLSISNKVFSDEIENYFMSVKEIIDEKYNDDEKERGK